MTTSKVSKKSFSLKKAIPLIPAFLLIGTYVFFEYHLSPYVVISPDKMIRPLVSLWLLLLALIFPVYKITKDIAWTGLALYFFALLFCLSDIYFKLIFYVGLLTVIVLAGAAYFILKKTIKIEHILFLCGVIPFVFFAASLTWIVPIYLSTDWKSYSDALSSRSAKVEIPKESPKSTPDIYYIVLDGYGRSDILQDYYGYDNSEFVNYLEAKEFIVPTGVHSNYAKTAVSVTSTMNMNYVSEFIPGVEDSPFWWQANPFLRESYARLFLEKLGYVSISIATDWDITNNPDADIYFKPYPVHFSEFEGNLLQKSQLALLTEPLLKSFAFYPTIDSHRDLILYNFEALTSIPKEIPGPKFIFAHIAAPHPPFVFDENGSPIQPYYGFAFNDGNDFPGTDAEYLDEYVGQVKYVNKILQKTIDAILRESETPPIIILQADHGPGMLTDFTSSENTCLRERFSTFGAYYLPGKSSAVIPDDITSVNLFRILFNEYFSTDFPLLENSSYYFKDTIYIYRTEDITAHLNEESPACVIKMP